VVPNGDARRFALDDARVNLGWSHWAAGASAGTGWKRALEWRSCIGAGLLWTGGEGRVWGHRHSEAVASCYTAEAKVGGWGVRGLPSIGQEQVTIVEVAVGVVHVGAPGAARVDKGRNEEKRVKKENLKKIRALRVLYSF